MKPTSRRDFIKLLGALGLALQTGRGTLALSLADDPLTPRRPGAVGVLSVGEKHGLWAMFQYIGQAWETAAFCRLDRAGLDGIVDLKTGAAPSYLAEYRAALARFAVLKQDGEEALALRRLFFEETDARLRQLVLAELIELHLAYGGFRALGYRNYRGYMGGSFSDPKRAPYRVVERR